jgi:hypothetical protein
MSNETTTPPVVETPKEAKSVPGMLESLEKWFQTLGPIRSAGKIIEGDHAVIQGFYERAVAFMKANAENVQALMKLYEEAAPVLEEIAGRYVEQPDNSGQANT